MTPKEKALDLVRSFYEVYPVNGNEYGMEWGMAKQCALIAVDEMIIQNGELYLKGIAKEYYAQKNAYLFEVKIEIENL